MIVVLNSQYIVGAGPQQRTEFCISVQVEQYEFTPVRGKIDIECVDDRARADRKIHHRLKGENGSQFAQPTCTSILRDPLLQFARHRRRLACAIDRDI
jgi:hypothetical protein